MAVGVTVETEDWLGVGILEAGPVPAFLRYGGSDLHRAFALKNESYEQLAKLNGLFIKGFHVMDILDWGDETRLFLLGKPPEDELEEEEEWKGEKEEDE